MATTEARLENLEELSAQYAQGIADLELAVLGVWLLLHAVNITFMQAGFALLELGSVRAKHAKSILFKNLADMGVSTLAWYLIGFGVAGPGASGAIGHDYALTNSENFLPWIHSFSFAVTSATVVSGAVAERMTLPAYIAESFILVSFLYAFIVRWCWDGEGFLAKDFGYVDFAGSGVVHVTGGMAALTACILVGPRTLRFQVEKDTTSGRALVTVADFRGHSPAMANLGVYILLVGWVSFNASSTLDASVEGLELAGRAAANTVIASAATMATCLIYQNVFVGSCDLPAAHNSILAGLAAITASCAYVDPWAAVVIGSVAFFVYKLISNLLIALTIDDPLDAFAVHGANGAWGVIAVAFFAKGDLLDSHFARGNHDDNHQGFVYGGDASLLAGQLLGLVVIMATVAVPTAMVCLTFASIRRPGGASLLRVDQDTELLGLDFKYHEGSAYPEMTKEDVEHHNLAQEAERRARARGPRATRARKAPLVATKSDPWCCGLCGVHRAVASSLGHQASTDDIAEEFDFHDPRGGSTTGKGAPMSVSTAMRASRRPDSAAKTPQRKTSQQSDDEKA